MSNKIDTSMSERFEVAFNRIHKKLQQLAAPGGNDRFSFLVKEGAKRHGVIRQYEEQLQQYARLRNAMVHEKTDVRFYIAEPHTSIVKDIEHIAGQFQRPQSALSIATAPVVYYYDYTPLKEVLATIQKHSYTQFPIYDKTGEYKWTLTSNMIINWMANNQNGDVIHLEQVKVRDLRIRKKPNEIAFISAFSDIFEAKSWRLLLLPSMA
ncbi:hypothetical protein [Ectobacillus ponti]|uniref:CBS domain-containing protein n=1 Tax=Ectobacillus ponti TaxID=2961894 RepID=A0AA41XA27_9BACI|nr:hypothetical protein [Ectobacillus ponti]MCP8969948.1 hypothetical protein [Ectobacillus ponti]